jgi:GTP cyclohydrolase I
MTSGHSQDPAEILGSALFPETCDEMIHVSGIVVNSLCVHHLLPFIGRAHVAYIPGENPKQSGRHVCVGLSKIPRMVTALARRLQTQERLTEEIVDVFYDTVKPAGVAVHIVAFHCCMSVRGAFEHMANTQTTAMRGCMRQGEARAEFLSSLDRSPLVLL